MQFYHGGKQVRESSKSTKLAVAERLLRKRLGESEAGILQPPRSERYKYEEMRGALIAAYVADGNRWLKRGGTANSTSRSLSVWTNSSADRAE